MNMRDFFHVNLAEEDFKLLIGPFGESWVDNVYQKAVNDYY